MNYDIREKKLPKWAQDLIANERLKSDFTWPSVPRPEPMAVFDSTGFSLSKIDIQGLRWRVTNVYSGPYAEIVYFKGRYIYTNPKYEGFGSRPSGKFYATERDAAAEAWWLACEMAAKTVHVAAQRYRESSRTAQAESE